MFCQLIATGENESVIFKLESNALNNNANDNGELARDIISLANHRGGLGYIIIGVSKNGPEFKSVTNLDFTQERLQGFSKSVIFPEPTLVLTKLTLESQGIEPDHQNKTFIIIQVGPQLLGVFRFNYDFVDFSQNICFRKNEVWVRHKTASVLATPEEIEGLFKGGPISSKIDIAPNQLLLTKKSVNYLKLPTNKVISTILSKIESLATQTGGKLIPSDDPIKHEKSLIHHLILPINGNPILFRVLVTDQCITKGQIRDFTQRYLTFEHGIFIIALADVLPAALEYCPTQMKQPWGWFFTNEFGNPSSKERDQNIVLPEQIQHQIGTLNSIGIALSHIVSDKTLHQSWLEMMKALQQNDDIQRIIDLNYHKMMAALTFYLQEGCPKPASKNLVPKKLLTNEIYDPVKYGNVLMIKQPDLYDTIIKLLQKTKL